MFEVDAACIRAVLNDFGVTAGIESFLELQRYHYEADDPESKEVRLIIRVNLNGRAPVVIRFKHEEDVNIELIESQSRFAETLSVCGVNTPHMYKSGGAYAKQYVINGYDVIVTAEEFVFGEIKRVDAEIAYKTGKLLAVTHNISQAHDCHVNCEVLFNPFSANDLFSYEDFLEVQSDLTSEDAAIRARIIDKYDYHMSALASIKDKPSYAVQGDISNNNLYLLDDGRVGVFDFNRCGDNNLYCDAIMQAVFEARFMDYAENLGEDRERVILPAFLRGYNEARPFTYEQRCAFPHLYAIIDAFWRADMIYGKDGLLSAHERGDGASVRRKLELIEARITAHNEMPI